MCDRCPDQFDRRAFLKRAAVVGGAATAAGAVLLPEMASARTATLEAIGLGEDRLPTPRSLEARVGTTARPRPAARVRPPKIVSRAQWGADESIRTWERAFAPIRKLIVHHTTSPTNPRDPVGWVRKTYQYHVLGRGYSDVGYNFLIDHRGVIYEGRWARNYGPGDLHDGESVDGLGVIGGHALNRNTGSCGICLIGDFTAGRPTNAMIASLTQLLAWKCAQHQIDPLGSDRYVSLTGEDLLFPNICGHKDVGNTICPGPYVFNLFPAIRQAIRRQVGAFPARTINLPAAIRYNHVRPPAPTARPAASAASRLVGYRILTDDGRVTARGKAAKGSSPREEGATDAFTLAPAPGSTGYFSLDRRGGVLAFGGASWYGSLRSRHSVYRPVDLAATRRGDGYWILANNGGVFAHGAAQWYGSLSHQSGRVVPRKLRATPSSRGYWLLTAAGRIHAFGDATKAGSPADRGRTDVVDFTPTPSGKGYWVLLSDGSVMAFGDAPKLGDLARRRRPVSAIMAAPNGKGYYILAADGSVTPFGKLAWYGGAAVRGRRALAIAPVMA